MESGAGIYRSADTLRQTCGVLADLRARYRKIAVAGQEQRLQHRSDPDAGARLHARRRRGHGALGAASARNRAARTSASITPKRDDANYLKHTLARYRGADPPSVSYLDVVITKSQPAERVYGGAAT